jgi:hypothetical protein
MVAIWRVSKSAVTPRTMGIYNKDENYAKASRRCTHGPRENFEAFGQIQTFGSEK